MVCEGAGGLLELVDVEEGLVFEGFVVEDLCCLSALEFDVGLFCVVGFGLCVGFPSRSESESEQRGGASSELLEEHCVLRTVLNCEGFDDLCCLSVSL